MKIDIDQNRLYFSGRKESELRRFLDKPTPITIHIKDLTDNDSLQSIAAKLPSAVLHNLNILTWTDESQINIKSIKKTRKAHAIAVIVLGQHAWEEAFGQVASEAWQKAHKKRELRVARTRRISKKIRRARIMRDPSARTPAKTNPYRNALVCIKHDYSGKLRVKPVSNGEAINTNYNVAFPRRLRVPGAQYVVEELVKIGHYYRAKGKITRVV